MTAHGEILHVGVSRERQAGTDERFAWEAVECGHCGRSVSAAVIAVTDTIDDVWGRAQWLRCTSCGKPIARVTGHNFLVGSEVQVGPSKTWPGPLPGGDVDHLPRDLIGVFHEARVCFREGAYTACELVARKILMHVATLVPTPDGKKAAEGLKFVEYIDHLEAAGVISPSMRTWVDRIRKNGNLATHELPHATEKRARSTLRFVEQLLRIAFEMPGIGDETAEHADETSG